MFDFESFLDTFSTSSHEEDYAIGLSLVHGVRLSHHVDEYIRDLVNETSVGLTAADRRGIDAWLHSMHLKNPALRAGSYFFLAIKGKRVACWSRDEAKQIAEKLRAKFGADVSIDVGGGAFHHHDIGGPEDEMYEELSYVYITVPANDAGKLDVVHTLVPANNPVIDI